MPHLPISRSLSQEEARDLYEQAHTSAGLSEKTVDDTFRKFLTTDRGKYFAARARSGCWATCYGTAEEFCLERAEKILGYRNELGNFWDRLWD